MASYHHPGDHRSGEHDGKLRLAVEFREVVFIGSMRNWFANHLTGHLMAALGARTLGAHSSTVTVDVERGDIENAVRAIRSAVAELNEKYPMLLAQHEEESQRRRVEESARRRRLEADQEVIDRIMSE